MKAIVYENRAEWLVPAALIVLSAVPLIAGAVRIAELTGGAEVTPENARFFASPLPVVLHILSVSLYSILGAFQFAPGFRRAGSAGTAPPGDSWSHAALLLRFRVCGWPISIPGLTATVSSFMGCGSCSGRP
jgi:hypothetical protein